MSMKDVAESAGVSISTVTRALNNKGYVDAQTRQHVLAHARKVQYFPNRAARNLRLAKSTEIAMVTWSMDELHVNKMKGLAEVLGSADYTLEIVFGADEKALADQSPNATGQTWPPTLLNELITRRPAGVVLLARLPWEDEEVARSLQANRIPYVVINSFSTQVDNVGINRSQGIYDAVLYLAETGRKSIGYFGLADSRSRLDGYERACAALNRPPLIIPAPLASDGFSLGRAAAREVAAMHPRPDAIQAFTDEHALGLLAGFHDLGLAVPREIALVGFDDRRAASLSWPRLTTVAQPGEEIGRVAADILLRKIRGENAPADGWSRMLPTRLVIRESA